MKKPTALLLASILLGGCASTTGSPPTASPTLGASVAVQSIGAPVLSPTATTSPAPSLAPSSGCVLVGPDDVPDLFLHAGSNTTQSGLNSAVPGSEVDTWHQPAPDSAVVVTRAEALILTAAVDPATPLCLATVEIDATPFSPTATQPNAAMIQPLPSGPVIGGAAATVSFPAPNANGEWVVRGMVRIPAKDGSTSLVRRFWRLRIGVGAPSVGGRPSTTGACGAPGASAPVALLAHGAKEPSKGQSGSRTWRGTSADAGDEPLGTPVSAPTNAHLSIAISDRVCAGGWQVVVARRPLDRGGSRLPLEPFANLVAPLIQAAGVTPGSANHFTLDDLAAGDWVVRASFDFLDASGTLVGQTTNYWNVVVR